MKTKGKVTGIVSNLVTVQVDGPVAENELCYITLAGTPLLAEVIKVSGDKASVQVFESTRGLKNGDPVEFEGRMLEVTLCWSAYGPGCLRRWGRKRRWCWRKWCRDRCRSRC